MSKLPDDDAAKGAPKDHDPAQGSRSAGPSWRSLEQELAIQRTVIDAIGLRVDRMYETIFTGNGKSALLVQVGQAIDSNNSVQLAVNEVHAAVRQLDAKINQIELTMDRRLMSVDQSGSQALRQFVEDYRRTAGRSIERNTAVLLSLVSAAIGTIITVVAEAASYYIHASN